jgi:hypothetical protein
MDEKLLTRLLRDRNEQDWFDFKESLKLYQADGKLVEKQRDELLKDILGLANGNSHIIRKTKYLVIGADNEKFDEKGMRVLHNVNYKVPSQSDLVKWLNSAASPAVVGIETELVSYQESNLWVISIPPTFELHETTRELNASGHFQKHVVFMRRDEHTEPASVREGITIQQLKYVFRQEIANPSASWVGAIAGGVVAFIIGGAKVREAQLPPLLTERIVQWLFTGLGIFFGANIGWFTREWNETRYAWRYMTLQKRLILIVFVLITIGILYFIYR